MDAASVLRHGASVLRQGVGSLDPRSVQYPYTFVAPRQPPIPAPRPRQDLDSHGPFHSTYTLTACVRCRNRKTRCDPALPRCRPCQRSDATCEYHDSARNQKINRNYIVHLQTRVKELEDQLKKYTDDDVDTAEEANIRAKVPMPGGLVHLHMRDEVPRYLGPSSGIAMTRLLMDEAMRYSEARRICDLVPEVLHRRQEKANRMQSVVETSGSISGPSGRKKSYPMMSEVAAEGFPSRVVVDRLLDLFHQRAQIFSPVLHEKMLLDDVEAVFDGDTDPYKNFVVRMVVAISLQKLDPTWAGLADSYYLAAMQYFEDVVASQDLKTLQCLVLVGQYSLLTPIRTPVYYMVGIAVKISQQIGILDEKTIALGTSDARMIDLRRRLSWIVTANELGLAHIMGRPSGLSKTDDVVDVEFFDTARDEDITPDGIVPGPKSETKAVAIHFYKMRLLQAEIRRVLYEEQPTVPTDQNKVQTREPFADDHPWFSSIKQKMDDWLESSPVKPEWAKPWFTGRYHSMTVMVHRPSPRVPKPSGKSALKCFEAAHQIINLANRQVKNKAIDITWVFLLTVYLSLNALLWSITNAEVRAEHTQEDFEKLVHLGIEIVELCSERWPGASSAAQLYSVFAKAFSQSYHRKEPEEAQTPPAPYAGQDSLGTPKSLDASSPDSDSTTTPSHQGYSQQPVQFHSPFSNVFGATPEEMSTHYTFEASPPAFTGPSFRSNSIFHNPTTANPYERRGSYFPPDFTHDNNDHSQDQRDESTPPATLFKNEYVPGQDSMPTTLPTPPESLAPPSQYGLRDLSPSLPMPGLTTASGTPTPVMPRASPVPTSLQPSPVPPPSIKFEPAMLSPHSAGQIQQDMPPPPPPRKVSFANQQPSGGPPPIYDWNNVTNLLGPPPNFSSGMHASFSDGDMLTPFVGLGLSSNGGYGGGNRGGMPVGAGGRFDSSFDLFAGPSFGGGYQFARQGSLSQEQQVELSNFLEEEGMADIDAILSGGMNLGAPAVNPVRWG